MPNYSDLRLARINDLEQMQETIPKCYLSTECDLMMSKWPLYRFMSPKKATDLFIQAYDRAYKQSWAINQDRDEAVRMTPTAKLDTTRNNAKYTQMWLARQAADMFGVPYEFYLEFCFYFASRRNSRKYQPQPNQLGPKSKTEIAWHTEFHKAWDNYRPVAFQRLEPMVQYTFGHRCGLPAQVAFETQLCDLVRNAALNARFFVCKRHVELQQLSEATRRDLFGDDMFDTALEVARSELADGLIEIRAYDPPLDGETWQACLGVTDVDHASSPVCASCGQKASCLRVRDFVQERVKTTHGSTDPLRAKHLANGRIYAARSRAKKKQAALLGSSADAIVFCPLE